MEIRLLLLLLLEAEATAAADKYCDIGFRSGPAKTLRKQIRFQIGEIAQRRRSFEIVSNAYESTISAGRDGEGLQTGGQSVINCVCVRADADIARCPRALVCSPETKRRTAACVRVGTRTTFSQFELFTTVMCRELHVK